VPEIRSQQKYFRTPCPANFQKNAAVTITERIAMLSNHSLDCQV
jgi:hypothetical protein